MHVKLINMLQAEPRTIRDCPIMARLLEPPTIEPSTSEKCKVTTVADWACGAVWGRGGAVGGHELEELVGPQHPSDQWKPAIFVRKQDCATGLTLCYCTDRAIRNSRAGKVNYTRVKEFGPSRFVREKLPQETPLKDVPQAVIWLFGNPHGPLFSCECESTQPT